MLQVRQTGWEKFDRTTNLCLCSIRRGYQVYREVCSACHSLDRIAWRNLIDVSHSEDEVKAMAEEVEYEDGPDDAGEMFQRPGKVCFANLIWMGTVLYMT